MKIKYVKKYPSGKGGYFLMYFNFYDIVSVVAYGYYIMGLNDVPFFESFEESKKSKVENTIDTKQLQEKQEKAVLLPKINDILGDFGVDEKTEDKYREILLKTDTNTLKDLLTKSKLKIEQFLIQVQIKELKAKGIANLTDEEFDKLDELSDKFIALEKQETANNNISIAEKQEKRKAYEEVNAKLGSIKGSLDRVKGNNETISTILDMIDQADKYKVNPQKATKDEVIESTGKMNEVLDRLILFLKQNPGALKSITDALGGAKENNPEYLKFKEAILSVDSSFKPFFDDLENIEIGSSFSSDEIVDGVEKDSGGVVDIDLKNKPPLAKLRLIGTDYGFSNEINEKELNKIMQDSKDKIEKLRDNYSIISEFGIGFNNLKNEIIQIWGKENFMQNLSEIVYGFPRDIFDKLNGVYENIDIPVDMQLQESDILSLADIEKPEDLQQKIENIKNKYQYIQAKIKTFEKELITNHKKELKDLLKEKSEKQKRQVELLKFFNSIGFDILPKNKTDIIVNYLNRTPGKFGLDHKIDFKDGDLGFNKDFGDKDLNSEEKREFIKLFNKMLGEDIVDENIAYKKTSLSLESRSKLQRLQNKTVGFFQKNLSRKNN